MITESKTFRDDIKVGDIVTLKDEQTILDLMKSGVDDAANGVDAAITRIRKFKNDELNVHWVLCDLEYSNQSNELFLVAKIAGDSMDIRVFFIPDDFTPGSRNDLLNDDAYWLFQEPKDLENFIPSELKFSEVINQIIDDEEINYKSKNGEIYGEVVEHPGGDEEFATIMEWVADIECENPEIICFEIGGLDEDGDPIPDGGFVLFFQGASIGVNDLEIMPT